MKKGLKAEISVSAVGNKKYEGKVTIVSQVADRFSRTYEAKIKVINTELELKPGMVCVITSYSIHYTKLYDTRKTNAFPLLSFDIL